MRQDMHRFAKLDEQDGGILHYLSLVGDQVLASIFVILLYRIQSPTTNMRGDITNANGVTPSININCLEIARKMSQHLASKMMQTFVHIHQALDLLAQLPQSQVALNQPWNVSGSMNRLLQGSIAKNRPTTVQNTINEIRMEIFQAQIMDHLVVHHFITEASKLRIYVTHAFKVFCQLHEELIQSKTWGDVHTYFLGLDTARHGQSDSQAARPMPASPAPALSYAVNGTR